jgi:hypothetical protein
MKGRLTQISVPYDQYNFQLFKIGMEVVVDGCNAMVVSITLNHHESAKTRICYTFEDLEDYQ